MWRGLILNRALQQFLEDVRWGDLDYLLIDMPPGTGDISMGLARMLPRAEVLVVTTPPIAAQKVAGRAADMFRRAHVRVAGVIENMTAFECEHGASYALFGEGGGDRLAAEIGVPVIGRIPLHPEMVASADRGEPVAHGDVGPLAEAFAQLASQGVEGHRAGGRHGVVHGAALERHRRSASADRGIRLALSRTRASHPAPRLRISPCRRASPVRRSTRF